jgi:hypothetical protein
MVLLLLGGCLLLAPAPDSVQRLLDPGDVVTVGTSDAGVCAVHESGLIECSDPTVSPPSGKFVAIQSSSGWCALRTDGGVECFHGVDGPSGVGFETLAMGGGVGCGIRDGAVECWGDDLGEDPPWASSFQGVAVGDSMGCALPKSEVARATCWGEASHDSVPFGGLSEIAVAGDTACGILIRTSEILCWGPDEDSPLVDPPSGDYSQITAGDAHFCARRLGENSVDCWGDDSAGQATPVDGAFIDIDAGGDSTCGVRENGVVACWGTLTLSHI